MKSNPDMKKFDQLGMYPFVPRVVAVGDLHELKSNVQALRLGFSYTK